MSGGHEPRIHVEQALAEDQTLSLARDHAHHLHTVLRRKAGDPVLLFNGDGHEYRAQIDSIDRKGVSLTISERESPQRESPLNITLVQGIARGERMDYAIAKAVELGVRTVQPLETRRVKNRLDGERMEKKLAHWRKVATSAAEQAGRLLLPEVHPPVSLATLLEAGAPQGIGLVLDPDAAQALDRARPSNEITLIIGPEGGLTKDEIEAIREANYTAVNFGPRILRTETAGPAALTAIQLLWGDLLG